MVLWRLARKDKVQLRNDAPETCSGADVELRLAAGKPKIASVASSATLADRILVGSGLAARTLCVNSLALFLCDLLLGSFSIHGVSAYLIAAIGIELPTLAWIALAHLGSDRLERSIDNPGYESRAASTAWAAGVFTIWIMLPILLMTSVPGILVAVWLSPSLNVHGFWTYVDASAITATIILVLRNSRPFKGLRGFIAGPPDEESARGTDA
jgi:uncharacterized membrane protein YvlD (DUF360 family)